MTRARFAVDAVAMALLAVLALAPLAAAYESVDFWVAAVGGVLLGTAIGLVGALLRWGVLVVAAVTVVAYFVFGGVLVLRDAAILGFVPGLDVLTSLAVGVVHVWKQTLTLATPFLGFDELLIAPYVAGLVCAVVAVSLALRTRRFGLALIPVGMLLIGAIAFSTYAGFHPALVGAAAGGIALAWSAWRVRLGRAGDAATLPQPAGGRRRGGTIAAALVLVVAVALSATAGTAAAAASRDVLRDHVVPPLELHDYASPLTSFRKYVTDDETELFTISGLPAGASVRLATLDLYDGIVYKVSGSGGAGAGVFSRVGRSIASDTDGDAVDVSVTIGELGGVWVPTAGYLTSVAFGGADAEQRAEALHYNTATGTAVVTTGLTAGDTYDFAATIPRVPDEAALADAVIADIGTPAPAGVPDATSTVVETAIGDATTPVAQVRAIESYLSGTGYFSHGLTGKGQTPSRSGHGDARESDLLHDTSQMVGDDEQYAVAMALMVSQLGIPVRVVMGFTSASTTTTTSASDASAVTVTAGDVHAWVEVPFEGYGWVAFHPTPSEDRQLTAQTPQQGLKPRVQVPQPPVALQEPADLPPAAPSEAGPDDQPTEDLGWLWATLQIGGISLLVLALLLGPSLVFAILRLRRRRRRAGAAGAVDRVDGGWAEVLDAAVDVGTPLARGATRREQADALAEHYPDAGVGLLAARADTAVFGDVDPTPAEAASYWADVATATGRMQQAVPWHRRVRAALFPASLFGGRPSSRRGRSRKEGEDA